MARQKSILKLKGKLDDISFYYLKNEPVARIPGGFKGSRIKKEARYELTRMNGEEFGNCARVGKFIRDALYMNLSAFSDDKMVSRLNGLLVQIKNMDTLSVRGKRNVPAALASMIARSKLRNFNFNDRAILSTILKNTYNVNTTTGIITLNNLVTSKDLNFPEGTTHVTFKGFWSRLDFVNSNSETSGTNSVTLPIDDAVNNVVLTPAALPTSTGTDVFYLKIEFYQEINSILYPLKDNNRTSLAIIEVV